MIDTAIHDRAGTSSKDEDQQFNRLKAALHERLVGGLNLSLVRTVDPEWLREELRRGAEELCSNHAGLLSQADRERMIDELVYETLGLGPLEPLMSDPTVSDILINGPHTVYVERRGRLERTSVRFVDLDHLLNIVQRIASRVGRRIDEASPMVNARLPDGSRVNAVMQPLALDGALVSIRRFSARPLLATDLVARRSAVPDMLEFLAACVKARINIMISGGTGSGKTTLLNMLSGYIPDDERIVTIEDAAELQLQQPHVGRLETRPPNLEGRGEVTSRDLLRNSLRMRPDRIIVGECRGKEAFDMLQAMNTGHDGGMTTIHANDTRDAVCRLEMLIGMAAPELPMWFIHRQISSAIQIVVQTARLSGGGRKITQISEVTGLQGEAISMHDLFVFEQTGLNDELEADGHFAATGIRPQCLARLQKAGVGLEPSIFERGRRDIGRFGTLGLESCAMNSAWVTVLTCCTATLLVGATTALVYDLVFRYRLQINQRLDELSGKSQTSTSASLFKDLKQLDTKTSSAFADLWAKLQETLEQSGLTMSPRTLLGISIGLGAGLAAFAAIVSHRWWMAPIGLLPGIMAPLLYVRVKRARRLRRLALQLPEAFDVIGRAVHAGQTVSAAFQIVADDFESPISEEFRRCYEQQNLGMPYEIALRDLARRTGIMELRILVVALLVQSRSGGNMMELLTNLSTMVRKRLKLQMKVKALTGEGRMQANVLMVLPVLAFVCILVLAPDYASSLLHRPWLLAVTVAAQMTGAFWIRRITTFEF